MRIIYQTKSILNISEIKCIKEMKEISFEDFTNAINFKTNNNLVLLNRRLKKLELDNDYLSLQFFISKIHSVRIVNDKVWCVVNIVVYKK